MARVAAVAVLAAAALLLPAAAGARHDDAARSRWVLGVSSASGYSSVLERLDPLTLKRVPGPFLPTLTYRASSAFSPDRSRLALGGIDNGDVLIVDAVRLRRIGIADSFVLPSAVRTLWWPTRERLFALLEPFTLTPDGGSTCCGAPVLLTIDPRSRRVLAKRTLEGSPVEGAHTRTRLALLLAPATGIGPATLAVLDPDGRLRTAPLDVVAGQDGEEATTGIFHYSRPGLALDPSGGRAFVASSDGDEIAEVELGSLAVTYHPILRPTRGVRLPAAAAKGAPDGSTRLLRWLDERTLALSGYDSRASVDASGTRLRQTPAGVRLVDTSTWTARVLDADAQFVEVAPGALLTGGSTWDSVDRPTGIGLRIYGRDGKLRAHLFGSRVLWPLVVGGRAFVARGVMPGYTIVDVPSGRVVRTLRGRELPTVLG